MASKAALMNSDDESKKRQTSKWVVSVRDQWDEFANFLSDVRSEMRKVVTPSRAEVKTTTIAVILAVLIFGVYFFVVDAIFHYGLHKLLGRLGGF
jgi:preprotein translocase subunit SecE